MYKDIPDAMLNKHWLINDPNKIVDDALRGLVRCHPHLALLDIGRVVVQRDHMNRDKVKLLIGGGSGREPHGCGFVGSGMSTASVQGGIHSPPTPKLILQTMKELARGHDKGILVIIPDNLNIRLNTGLAVERAKNIPNMNIRMIPVDDNCDRRIDNQGMTGCILIDKIAGAMAEADHNLDDIYNYCRNLLVDLGSIATCLRTPASLQDLHFENSTYAKTVEYSPGINGQAGFSIEPLVSCHETVSVMLKYLLEKKPGFTLSPNVNVAVLVNNFGQASTLEELTVINEVIKQLQARHITVKRVYTGNFFTTLAINGFSLTILNLRSPDVLTYLDAETDAPYWRTFGQVILEPKASLTINSFSIETKDDPFNNRGPIVSLPTAHIIEHAITFACAALLSCEKQLNIIDSESGDADTGTNIRRAVRKISEYLSKQQKTKFQWPFMLFDDISNLLLSNEGLLSCLYAMMFEAAAKSIESLTESDILSIEHWIKIFDSICNAVEKYGETCYGNHTMYDALYKANIAFKDAISYNMGPLDCMGLAALAAEDAAQRTRLQTALHLDPGAYAVGIWMKAIYETMKVYPEQCK